MTSVQETKNWIHSERGFTYIELMIALIVASLTILFCVMSQNILQVNAETAYESKVAVQDAHRLLEQMRLSAKTGTFPANVVAAYPAGSISGYTSMPSSSSETMTLVYTSSTADPLDVIVTVTWTGNNRRASTQTLRTMMTAR